MDTSVRLYSRLSRECVDTAGYTLDYQKNVWTHQSGYTLRLSGECIYGHIRLYSRLSKECVDTSVRFYSRLSGECMDTAGYTLDYQENVWTHQVIL